MRNHNDKPRDMARSVLPSTYRRRARADRAAVRSRERARLRAELHAVAGFADPDDYDGDLTWVARRDLAELVADRRSGDKVGPLTRWAARTVEADPTLAAAPLRERLDHFRPLLPPGIVGRHALFHLVWALDDEPYWWPTGRTRPGPTGPSLHDKVAAIIAAGRHGELNRRIRHACAGVVIQRITLPREYLIDDDHPAPGLLLPRRTVEHRRRIYPRYLAGAHDIDAFVADTGRNGAAGGIAAALYRELIRTERR